LGQSGKRGSGRCLYPAEAQRAIAALNIHSVEEQHVQVDVQVERAAETLDQGDHTSLGRLAGKPRLRDQVRGDAAVDKGQHMTHDRRAAREQEAQRIRDAQHPLAHRLLGKHLVPQQRCAFAHTPGAIARTKAPGVCS